MKTEIFEEIGLTKSEVKVYLALLELGSSTTGKIVDKSGASSSKIYEILERLMQKGLVSFVVKSGTKYFEAAPPKRILDYLEERKKKLLHQSREVEKVIPELESKLMTAKEKSETIVFKGMEGSKTAFEDILRTLDKGDELVSISFSDVQEKFQDFLVKFHQRRSEKGVKFRAVFGESLRNMGKSITKMEHTQVRYYPTQKENPVAILAYKNKTLISLARDYIWIIIENERLADSFRARFEELWGQKVQTYQGQKAVEDAYENLIGKAKKSDDLVIFAAKPDSKKVADFNLDWIGRISKKVKKARALYYGDNEVNRERTKEFRKQGAETKIYPTEQKLPISTIVAGKTILNSVWGKNPTVFEIENKIVADSLKANFDLLWNQDVVVSKGWGAFEQALYGMVDEIKGFGYDVLGATIGTERNRKKYSAFFKKFHKYRAKNNVKVRLLFYRDERKFVEENKENIDWLDNGELKFLGYEQKSPVQVFVFRGKVILTIQEEEPLVIRIDNKEISESFQRQFDSLWEQRIQTYEGVDSIKRLFEEMLEFGDYSVFAEGMKIVDVLGKGFFLSWQKEKKKRKIHARGVIGGQYKHDITVQRAETKWKFIPGYENPGLTYVFKDKVVSVVLSEKPIAFLIDNKEVADNNQTYFDLLWKQDTRIVRGLDAIQVLFDEILEAGSVDYIGARGYFIDKKPGYIDKWEKEALRKGFKMRNIVDESVRGHRITKFPFTKTKYNLPKEFSELSVFWIYGGKVAISNWTEKEPFAVIIENKDLHDLYKKQFESLWNQEVFEYKGRKAVFID